MFLRAPSVEPPPEREPVVFVFRTVLARPWLTVYSRRPLSVEVLLDGKLLGHPVTTRPSSDEPDASYVWQTRLLLSHAGEHKLELMRASEGVDQPGDDSVEPISSSSADLLGVTIRHDDSTTLEPELVREEGDYWGEYLATFVEHGSDSILDGRARGTHPSYLHHGILQPDERDADTFYGVWPDSVARAIFSYIAAKRGGAALEVGCGGGQFALEAARYGLVTIGLDISRRSLVIGREYAIRVGVELDFICAVSDCPPVHPGSLDVLIAKDSLHHLPNTRAALEAIAPLVKPDAHVCAFDCVAHNPFVEALKRLLDRLTAPRIRRCYPPEIPVPDVLTRGSVLEETGRDTLYDDFQAVFDVQHEIPELWFYYHVERVAHYFGGKRRWFTSLCRALGLVAEWLLLCFIPPDFVTFLARPKTEKKKEDANP